MDEPRIEVVDAERVQRSVDRGDPACRSRSMPPTRSAVEERLRLLASGAASEYGRVPERGERAGLPRRGVDT
jgi:hypothetical protein